MSLWLGVAAVALAPAQVITPTITGTLSSSFNDESFPTHINQITSGAFPSSIRIYIPGQFNPSTFLRVNVTDPRTGATTQFTTAVGATSSSNLVTFLLPSSFYSVAVSAPVQLVVSVTEVFSNTTRTSNGAIFIVAPPMTSLGPTLPQGIVGDPYATNVFSGGTPPFEVSVGSETMLPPNLSLQSNGPLLSGTTVLAGDFMFTVNALDAWGGEFSSDYNLSVINRPPPTPSATLTSVVPNSASAGLAGLQITVNGTDFTNGGSIPSSSSGPVPIPVSIVTWTDGVHGVVPLQTTFVNAAQLTALIPATLLQAPLTATINVVQAFLNTAGTGGIGAVVSTSNGLPFTVRAPSITSLNPSSIGVGSPTFTLTVAGADFVHNVQPPSDSVVLFNGTALATTFVSSGVLTAQVPASLVAAIGTAQVQVQNPGGARSNIVQFPIRIVPVLLTIDPSSAVAGGPAFLLTATGTNLIAGMSILWNGSALAGTTLVAPNTLRATVPANLIAAPGTAQVSVAAQDGTVSNSLPFLIVSRLTITTTSLPSGIVGTSYSTRLTAIGGTPSAYRWSATGLPSGLTVNAVTGDITGVPTVAGTFQVVVTVTDPVVCTTLAGAACPITQTATAQFSLLIIPRLQITTTSLPAGNVGVNYSARLTATGGTPPYSWTASGLPPGLNLNAATGDITGVPTTLGNFTVTVRVADSGTQTATAQFTIAVVAPLVITTTSLPQATSGQPYGTRVTATGGVPPFQWTIQGLPGGLSFNPQTGDIQGSPSGSGTFSVTATVRDSAGQTASATFPLTVVLPIPPLQITTGSPLPQGTVGTPYVQAIGASGGTPGYTFSLAGGALPDGLNFAGDGTLSGTPTARGQFRFTVRVTDSTGTTALKDFVLVIAPGPLTLTGQTGDVPTGVPLTVQFGATGGVPPYIFGASGTLPPGTSFSNDGRLTGTPNTVGTFQFTVSVTDSLNMTVSRSFTIRVTPAPLTITSSLPNGQVGTAYSATLTATGGTPPFTWSAAGLPDGVSLAGNVVSGTPTTPGTFPVALTVTDSLGVKASVTQSVTIAPAPLTITTATLPVGVVGVVYGGATLAATGGVPPYTFSISGLPDGLGSGGASISGTPTVAGTFTINATVTDSRGTTATRALQLIVQPAPLTITTATLGNATVGAAFSVRVAAAGGVQPYSFSATGLPAGVNIAGDGTVSGTPTSPGTSNVTVTVTDANGATATRQLPLVVALPASPPLNLTGLPATGNPGTQGRLGVGITTPFPVPIVVTLTLTFTADTGPDDPMVQFQGGGRTTTITIPAGSLAGSSDVGVQLGTVAGNITITARLAASGQDLTPTPIPTRTIRISPSVPVITSFTVSRSGTGFTALITGYSSTRELSQAAFQFAGTNLQTNQITIPVGTLFAQWFSSAAASTFGGQFTLTQPFTVQGNAQAVTSVTVTMSNSVGASAPATANIQ